MKYGIFGGTFNPPHIGHVHAANAAAKALGLKIILIPDNIPPHKEMPAHSPTAEERLEMTRIMSRSIENSEVSDIEIKRGHKSYTADTLSELKELYPGDELYLIVGTDMLISLDRWYHPESIMRDAVIVGISREEDDRDSIESAAAYLREKFGARVEIIDAPALPAASTQVRDIVYTDGGRWLPDGVLEYIRERGLYRDA